MKRFLINFSLIAILFTGTTSCKKFLERPPEGQLTEEEAIQTEADVLAFANGIYTLLADNSFYGGRNQILNELLGDHYRGDFFTGDYSEIYKRQNSIFGGTRDDYYRKGYSVIARSNLLLTKLGLAGSNRNRVEGEALLFRAMAYFELVRMFAHPWGYSGDNSHLGIPLRTSLDLSSKPRATVAAVYSQIIADLLAAENLLPDVPPNGKYYTATKWAAKAMLAKVYFQQNDFAKAFQFANEVLSSNKFMLDTDFNHRFTKGLSKEGILSIVDSLNSFQPGGELRGAFRSDIGIPNFRLTDQFYGVATARAADLRIPAWYSNTLQPGFNLLKKYNRNNFDLPLIHLTEIKLIRAEAGAELGGSSLATAISDINELMTRAYGSNAFNLPLNSNASIVIDVVRKERELEMVGEGNRTQEIKRIGVRNGINVDRRGSQWNCNGFTLQFPKAEKDANAAFIMNIEGGCF